MGFIIGFAPAGSMPAGVFLFTMSSYANDVAAMMAQAQVILAGICDPVGEGAFTLSAQAGATYTGVMNEQDASDPLDFAGVKRVRYLFVYPTKAQFTTAPTASPRGTLTAKGVTWIVQGVTDLPQHYRIVCRPA